MNKKETALKMLIAGYGPEEVMGIVGLEPQELFDILTEVLGTETQISVSVECFRTQAGDFEMILN